MTFLVVRIGILHFSEDLQCLFFKIIHLFKGRVIVVVVLGGNFHIIDVSIHPLPLVLLTLNTYVNSVLSQLFITNFSGNFFSGSLLEFVPFP